MSRLSFNFCYYMFFLALAIRTAMGQRSSLALGGPPNITAILEKGKQFSALIRLMKRTQVDNAIYNELNHTKNTMTIFAPTDAAFSELPQGTLNGLKDGDKAALLQFHIIPSFMALFQFQTVSNPLRTQAGGTGPFGFPINVTTSGNAVNISTGVVNTTITGILRSDRPLAVYQVDKVLLPLAIFGPKPPPSPPPSPPPVMPKKPSPVIAQPPPVETSDDMGLRENAVVALLGAVVGVLWL